MDKTGYVYIVSSHSRRLWQHKNGTFAGFTQTFKINPLVYYEAYPDMLSAIAREKQLKGWNRAKKLRLILE